jgi:predicted nucleic acid binding AN1-type Zn finger protein
MEFYDIGKHCKECNKQDYLPFICNECNNYFCKEHIYKDQHNCIYPLQKNKKLVHKSVMFKCTYPKCKKKEFMELYCSNCKKNFCLTHRYIEVHKCNEIIKDVNIKNVNIKNDKNKKDVNIKNDKNKKDVNIKNCIVS